ncbi:MAG: hypothetical protein F9K31_00360 [Dokdonella sp.]|nr:MAG: hypothetical protein F9K31_00360 [Dokdonella sp.]
MRRKFIVLASILSLMFSTGQALAAPTDPDTSFDGDGELENPFPIQLHTNVPRAFRVAAWDAYNRILVGGKDGGYSGAPVALVGRVHIDGNPDTTYGDSGLASLSRFGVDGMTVNDLLVLPDGSALVCGDAVFPNRTAGYVARLDANGQQDVNWAPGSLDGVVILEGQGSYRGSRCLAVDQLGDGRIVAGGEITRPGPGGLGLSSHGLVVVRKTDGYEDPGFGENGVVEFELQQFRSFNTVFAVAEQPGNGILVTLGELGGSGAHDLNTLRLGYDGQLDPSFNPFIHYDAAPPTGINSPLASELMWPLPNGRIRQAMPLHEHIDGYVGKLYWVDAPRDGLLPDTAFLGHDQAGASLDFGGAALAPDGKVVYATRPNLSSQHCTISHTSLGLARLLANGQPDTGFSSSGYFGWQPVADFANECHQGVMNANDVALSRQGRILSLYTISQGWPNPTDTGSSVVRPLLSMRVGEAFGPEPWDTLPNSVSFAAASARPNSIGESDWVQVTGLDNGAYVPALVLGGELRIGFGDWGNARWVKNGDWLQVRGVAPSSIGNSRTVRLLVGGIRGHNSWDSLGQRIQADFVIAASMPSLPGARCSSGGFNTNCSATIADNSSVTSTINFLNGGSCNYVQRVRVGLDIEHTYIGDLRVTLTDPNGQIFIGGSEGIVTLLNRPAASASAASGSCGRDDIVASFDDAAVTPAQTACGTPVGYPALSGDVVPANPLSELVGRRTTGNNGADASGLWTLKIEDLANGDSGQLHDWSLDIDCSASAPAISDLSVAVSGQSNNPLVSGTGEAVPGDGVAITWTVTNNGPMATSNGRFRASLPTGLTDSIDNAAWGCTTSTGGNCTPAIPCFGACLGNEIDAALSLPVGGTATFVAIGTLTELAGDGTLVINGRSSVPLAIGGTRDNAPENDSAQLLMPIQRITDLAVTGTRHSWQGNTVTVEIDISNLGPSQNLSFTADFALPVGMQITNAECRRGNLPCNDGFTAGGGHLISLTDGNGLLPNRTPYTAILTATWNGAGAPGDMTIRTFTDATAIDTDNGATTTYTISAPSAGDIIFSNGFE